MTANQPTIILNHIPVPGKASLVQAGATPTIEVTATAAITFVASSADDSTGTGSVNPAIPTGSTTDDFMLLTVVGNDDATSFSVDDDSWVEIYESSSASGNDSTVVAYYKFHSGSESAPTVSWSDTSQDLSGFIHTFRNVDQGLPLDVIYSVSDHRTTYQNNRNPTNDDITTNTDGAWVVLTHGVSLAGTAEQVVAGAPSGYTLGESEVDANSFTNQFLAYKEVATAGTETPGAWTHTGVLNNSDGQTTTLALRPSQGGFVANAIEFDDTADEIIRSGGLSNGTDNKLLLFSGWVKFSANRSDRQFLWSLKQSNNWFCRWDTSGTDTLMIRGTIAGGTTKILDVDMAWSPTLDQWYHILFSCDLSDTGKRHFYIDGSSQSVTWNTYTDSNLDYTGSNEIGIGNRSGTDDVRGCLSEIYVTNEYMDLSNSSNREKFRTSGGKPEFLGARGDVPTGNVPLIYINSSSAESTTGFNAGDGGTFTSTGISACDDGPSD